MKDGATFFFPRNISIGKNVTINEWVLIDGFGGVNIGDCCRIGHGCSFVSEEHSFDRTDIPIYAQPNIPMAIAVGPDCYFGAGVRVLGGVTIGSGCVIGAGAVVNKHLPAYSIAVGVPARVIGNRKEFESKTSDVKR